MTFSSASQSWKSSSLSIEFDRQPDDETNGREGQEDPGRCGAHRFFPGVARLTARLDGCRTTEPSNI